MARVSVPFTEGHYYGRGERPNTELADNSPSIEILFPVETCCLFYFIFFRFCLNFSENEVNNPIGN